MRGITIRPEPPPGPEEPPRRLAVRLAWFVGLGVAGLAATATVAYGLRALLLAAGAPG